MKYRPVTLSLLLHAVALFFVMVYVSFPCPETFKKTCLLPLKVQYFLAPSSPSNCTAYKKNLSKKQNLLHRSKALSHPSSSLQSSFPTLEKSNFSAHFLENVPYEQNKTPPVNNNFAVSSLVTSPKQEPIVLDGTWVRHQQPQPRYPQKARDYGMEGKVLLRVHVIEDGTLKTVAVSKSSGHELLDREAIQAVKQWEFPIQKKENLYEIPIKFSLEEND
jgi:protein TonB